MDKLFLTITGGLGFLGVALGAFGAHGLREKLTPDLMAIYQTGVQYHLIHAVALGFVALACAKWPGTATTVAGWAFVAGIAVFSGSLYALALSGIRVLGAITPIGGVAFLVGWAALVWAAFAAEA